MRRIGVFGGLFDPVHFGDLRVARAAMEQLALEEIVIVPFQAPASGRAAAPRRDRLDMLTIAFSGVQGIAIIENEYEQTLAGLTDALRAVRMGRQDADIFLLMGTDQLHSWLAQRNSLPVLRSVNVALFYRRESSDEARLRAMALNVRVSILQMPALTISAHLARAQIGLLSDAPEVLPQPVAEYIAQQGLYKPPYAAMMRSQMTQKRYVHTLGVKDTAVRLARLHGASMQQAAVAGLLHDCAKCLPIGKLNALARRYTPDSLKEFTTGALLHGPVGAQLARVKYKVKDPDVLNAIHWHTVGRAGMSVLELCVYVADAIEPSRKDYPQLSEIRTLAQTNIKAATLKAMLATRDYVLSTGQGYLAGADALGDLQQQVG